MKRLISIVVPMYNEAENIELLYAEIRSVLAKPLANFAAEIIFINDGSTDQSLTKLKKIQSQDRKVQIVSFRKNLGKAIALSEGFKKTNGDIVVTLDGDLQDNPENLPELIALLDKGYDLVVGWKKQRMDGASKKLPSRLFNSSVRLVSRIQLHDFNSGFKVMRSDVAKELKLYGELHRFIPVLAVQRGFRVTEQPVNHRARRYGSSKYGLERFAKGFFDFLTVMFLQRFGNRPLHLFGPVGIAGIMLGIVLGGYLSILHFEGISISRRPLLILSVLLIVAGLQMLSVGLIAEMIVNRFNGHERPPIDYETE